MTAVILHLDHALREQPEAQGAVAAGTPRRALPEGLRWPAHWKPKDAVHNVANRLQTSFESTLWHLKNLGYIDDVTRQRIESEALPQRPA